MSNKPIGLIGTGFVGGSLQKSFSIKNVKVKAYDKYKNEGKIEDLIGCDVIFLCLPTPYVEGNGFDLGSIQENLKALKALDYNGVCVIKSTVEPGVTRRLSEQYNLKICHNPEFLSEKTAFDDFHNQKHIVIGLNNGEDGGAIIDLYKSLYKDAKISVCKSEESEAMKLFCNNFYAMKVQIFNEFYFLCQKIGADFYDVKDIMLKNEWINEMHTQVPGNDGAISYGGHCFPKDTKALCHFMDAIGSPNGVLRACIEERDSMRESKLK